MTNNIAVDPNENKARTAFGRDIGQYVEGITGLPVLYERYYLAQKRNRVLLEDQAASVPSEFYLISDERINPSKVKVMIRHMEDTPERKIVGRTVGGISYSLKRDFCPFYGSTNNYYDVEASTTSDRREHKRLMGQIEREFRVRNCGGSLLGKMLKMLLGK